MKISAILLKYPTFEGGFFHIFIHKVNKKLEFLYVVAFALKILLT